VAQTRRVLTVPFELRLLLAAKPDALSAIVTTVASRAVRWLEKHGYLRREGEEDPAENADTDSPWMRCLQGSLGLGELQRWAEHGRSEEKAEPARGSSLPEPTKRLAAQHLKFNLHAGVRVPGGLPAARERLVRYCGSPSPRAPAAVGARGWQDLLPHQGHRAGAAHDADAVHGTPCCLGTPTAPSIGALLWKSGHRTASCVFRAIVITSFAMVIGELPAD